MRLLTIDSGDGPRAGVMTDEGVILLRALGKEFPDTVIEIIEGGAKLKSEIAKALASSEAKPLAEGEYTVLAPIPRPRKNIFCVGKNYIEHAKEFQNSGFDQTSGGQDVPELPIVFTKAPTSVTGPGTVVDSRLDPTGTLDYEGELGVVIGRGGRGISRADAYDHVYGYVVINDITARETQNAHKQWFLGKSPDTFCPMGPMLVTADEIGDVTALNLITRVNGEVRQDAVVKDLIFDIPTIIETISRSITLEPGDIIATGTPVGVAIGFTPPRYLCPGDRVEVEIGPLGKLVNTIG
ncbi:fumarylacetoacetate hydrolase family protein [Alkalilacustris brevis]|uniref:fumarylacetoacetate hydrolase family protein n=1 Tax=Alkalilacustris brevis TaxID=2026338 RepID=UPI000E0CDE37|nr:fumarylacetoacetate hydrolase family protein [Alkalilacustris brevis]